MSNALTNQPANRVASNLTDMPSSTHHHKPIRNIFKNSRSAKKQQSLALNKAEFVICPSPDESEILQSMNSPDTHGHNNTNQLDSTISDNTITDRQPHQTLNTPPNSPNKHRLISQFKNRFKHDSSKSAENDEEKNRGFLLIDRNGVDIGVISSENSDLQHTRHAEPCEHESIDDDIVDINDIHLEPTTPATPHLLPPTQSSLPNSTSPLINHSTSESDVQATQAGVECDTSTSEGANSHETQSSSSSATTNSSSSTNSSNTDTHSDSIAQTIVNDNDHILAQKRGLERITIYEISLNDERRDYQQDLSQERDELEFKVLFDTTLQLNAKLKEELRRLQEEKSRTHSPWSCEVCTYINEPYIRTGRDVCEICEGPSPLKRHALTS